MTKKIDILDLSDKKGKKAKKVHPDLPTMPFFIAFVGPSRSGKSNCIKNLLLRKDLYGGKFEHIFIFCPTIDLNGDFDQLNTTSKTKVLKIKHFDENMISEIMRQQEIVIKDHGKNNAPDILLLLDDCFDDSKFNRSQILKTLAFRGRHSKISTILSGQKLSMMSTSCRNNLTGLAFFRPGNMNELQFYIDENCEKSKKKETAEAMKQVWKEPYKFIFIDYLAKDVNNRYKKGFSESLGIEF